VRRATRPSRAEGRDGGRGTYDCTLTATNSSCPVDLTQFNHKRVPPPNRGLLAQQLSGFPPTSRTLGVSARALMPNRLPCPNILLLGEDKPRPGTRLFECSSRPASHAPGRGDQRAEPRAHPARAAWTPEEPLTSSCWTDAARPRVAGTLRAVRGQRCRCLCPSSFSSVMADENIRRSARPRGQPRT